MMLSLFDLIVNLLQSLCLGFLASSYFSIKRKYPKGILTIGLSLIVFMQVSFFNSFGRYEGVLLIFYVITIALFGVLFSDNNRLECFSLGLAVLIMISATNLSALKVADLIVLLIGSESIELYMFIAKALAVLFMAMFSWVIVKFRNQLAYLEYKMFSKYLATLILINLIITLLETMYYGSTLVIDYMEYSLILIIILSLVITKLFFDLQNEYRLFHQTAILREHLEQLSVQFSEIKDREDKISTLKHDMQNIVTLIKSLILSKEYDKAISIIETKSKEIDEVESLVYTGNVMIDAALNTKKSLALKQGIQMKIVFCPLQFSDEEAFDFAALLYTSLDNAIENCSKSTPVINVYLERTDNIFTIRVTNYVSNDVLKDNPELRTTKSEKEHHGYGIPNMKRIIKKYDGYLFFNQQFDEFECKMILSQGFLKE